MFTGGNWGTKRRGCNCMKAIDITVEKFYAIDFKWSCVVQTIVSSAPRRNRSQLPLRFSLSYAFACYKYFSPAFWFERCTKGCWQFERVPDVMHSSLLLPCWMWLIHSPFWPWRMLYVRSWHFLVRDVRGEGQFSSWLVGWLNGKLRRNVSFTKYDPANLVFARLQPPGGPNAVTHLVITYLAGLSPPTSRY